MATIGRLKSQKRVFSCHKTHNIANMLKEERFQYILGKLSEDQKVTLKTLSKELGISEYTVRRDLKELTDKGLLKAVRGGAIPHSPTPHHFQDRLHYKSDEKKIIAEKAAGTVTSRPSGCF